MKKIFTLFLAVAILFTAGYAASPVLLSLPTPAPVETPVLNAKNIMLPVGHTGKTISLMELSTINVRDFQALTGKKLGFFDKIGFKLGQKKLRNKIEEDGTIKGVFLKKYATKMAEDGDGGFHFGGFALGFFLGLIGVLIAYLINDDNKSRRVKWAWIAWGITAVIALIALLA